MPGFNCAWRGFELVQVHMCWKTTAPPGPGEPYVHYTPTRAAPAAGGRLPPPGLARVSRHASPLWLVQSKLGGGVWWATCFPLPMRCPVRCGPSRAVVELLEISPIPKTTRVYEKLQSTVSLLVAHRPIAPSLRPPPLPPSHSFQDPQVRRERAPAVRVLTVPASSPSSL